MRIGVAVLLLLQGAAAQRPAIQAGIQGVVLGAGPEMPIPLTNARVELTPVDRFAGPSAEPGRVEHTDENGRFGFAGVRAGQYRVSVTRNGYLRKEYDEVALGQSGPPVRFVAGQPMDLRLVLDPAPSIGGRITDETGEALPEMLVTALRFTYDLRGNRLLETAFSAETNDRGEYRLYWIDPGEYFISAFLATDPFFNTTERVNGEPLPPLPGLAPTYYPGFATPANGQTVKVGIGTEVVGIDFRMTRDPALAQRMVTLRGINLLSKTDLPGRSRIALIRTGTVALAVEREEPTGADGAFEIGGVEPGEYVLIGQAIRLIAGGREAGRELGFARILVSNRDVNNIEILPSSGIRMEGRVAVSGPARGAGRESSADLRAIHVELRSTLPPVFPIMSSAVQANGAFTLDRFFLGAEYAISLTGLPGDLYMKSARLGVTDILEGGAFHVDSLSRAPGADQFDIALGADGGNLKGTVFAAEDDAIVTGALVTLVPDSTRRRRPDQYRTAVTDKLGNYTIRGIPPGNYSLLAWKRLEANAYLNAEFLAPSEIHALPVRIEPGANAPIGLRVVPDR